MKTGFSAMGDTGTQLTFENGLTISITWSTFAMCSNKIKANKGNLPENERTESATAEVAVIADISDTWYDFSERDSDGKIKLKKATSGGFVEGFMTADMVAELIQVVSQFPTLWSNTKGN